MDKSGNNVIGTRAADAQMRTQVGIFAFCTIVAGVLAYNALDSLVSIWGILGYGPMGRVVHVDAGVDSEYYSHILLIPFVSAYFLFLDRRTILQRTRYSYWGLGVAACGVLTYGAALMLRRWLGQNDFGSLAAAGSLVFWWGGFLFAFGPQAFRAACFPLLFLLFVIPIPQALMDWFISLLQISSTEVTEWLFQLTSMDYIRRGFIFVLPNISIEVAKECSGIRSSIALIITGVLAGHLFLRSPWRKLILIVAMIPFTILKNGVRITTLSLLAVYVDKKFIIESWLDHAGGFVFYLPALGLLALMLWWFRRQEKRS